MPAPDNRSAVDAIITARGGSKGLLRKNLRPFSGKPLIVHTIEAALKCTLIRRCYVSTEDPEIKAVSLAAGAEVIDRPPELAQDASQSEDAVRHALEVLREREVLPEYFALLQPTSPLRTSAHLAACLSAFFASGAACAISVTEEPHHPYKSFWVKEGQLLPFGGAEFLSCPRQSLPPVYRQNGAIYVMECELFLATNHFFASPALPFVMAQESSLDIDSEFDLALGEWLMSRKAAQ